MSIDKTDFHTSATKVEVIRVDTATPILNSKLAALINTCIEHPQVTPFEIPFNYINLTNPESKGCHNHIFFRSEQVPLSILVRQLGQQLFTLCAQCTAVANA